MSVQQSRYTWALDTVSTAGTAIDFRGFGVENSFYVENGAASSGTITIESARTSSGPWATIASTGMATTGTAAVMEVTGPLLFVRPRVASTVGGTWTIEAVSYG